MALNAKQMQLMQGPASPLSREANELICMTGQGTPMGEVVRRYWVPALLSTELPAPDCDPVQVRLLGEDLVAFRDTKGRVGIVQWWCAHRGTPLWMGRNEEDGIRCLYHGWKYDVNGDCVDQMSEPSEAQFKDRVKLISYPTVEMGQIIWAYMGPPDKKPPDPEFEFTQVPSSHLQVSKVIQECNWVQAVEGGIDPAHARALHGAIKDDEDGGWGLPPSSPFMTASAGRYFVEHTDYGHRFWEVAKMQNGDNHVMAHHFVMPWTQIRAHTVNENLVPGHFYVPIDDDNCMVWNWVYSYTDQPLSEFTLWYEDNASGNGPAHVDQTTFRSFPNRDNKWGLDREAQRTVSFSGVKGINVQDRLVQEAVGPVVDRSRENLGQSDLPIIGVRKKLMEGVALVSDGGDPAGIGKSYYELRAFEKVYPNEADWKQETMKLMHPKSVGGA